MKRNIVVTVMALLFLSGVALAEDKQEEHVKLIVTAEYPLLTSGALSKAKLVDLPADVLLKVDDIEIKAESINEQLKKAPEKLREQLRKNKFLLLENMATEQLLLLAAKKFSKVNEDGTRSLIQTYKEDVDTRSIIQEYMKNIASTAEVSDADVKLFYDESKVMMSDVPFEQIKAQIKQNILQQKQQELIREHIRTFGDRMEIQVNYAWTKEQAKLAMDNPVDEARASGKPSMVDFGAQGCEPCNMMTPILADMEKKFSDKVNVLFVSVSEEHVLGARYGIHSIPTQLFFDKNGKEIFRHSGFLQQDECERWIKKAIDRPMQKSSPSETEGE